MKSQAVKNTLMLMISNGFLGLFAIATQILVTNTLGRTLFGQYASYMAIGTYGACIVRYGRERTMVRDIIQHPGDFERIFCGTVILSLILAVAFNIGLLFFAFFSNMPMSISLWLVVTANILISFDLQPVYDSWRQMGKHATYFLIRRLLEYTPIWILVLSAPFLLSINYIATVAILASLFVLYFQYHEVIKGEHTRIFCKQNWFAACHQLRENFEIALGTFLLLFIGPTIQLFLKRTHGPSEVGIYAAALQILLIINFVFSQLSRIGRPAMARVTLPEVSRREKRTAVFQYALVMFLTSFPLAFPMFFFPKWIVGVFFKPEFAEAAHILPILAIYNIVLAQGMVFVQYIQSARHDRLYSFGVFGGAALSFIFGFTIIPWYGLSGAAWSLLIAHGFSIFLYAMITLYSLYFRPDASFAGSVDVQKY
ncbi:MAG: oligosaccharide flippase family protein [Planctomycetaceae bacterium]|nr:oligosaccharide flippase family protein [Planctomycetaceae bacterium]